jgi:hypothetical protein
MCRRAVGNAFATLVWFDRQKVAWSGETPASYSSSAIANRCFCRHCGTPLFMQYRGPSQIALMLGCFDDAAELRPTHHYGIEARLPWVDIGETLPGSPTESDPRPK